MRKTRFLAATASTTAALLIALVTTGTAEASIPTVGCTTGYGDGDQNETCIDLYGTAMHVDQIKGSLNSASWGTLKSIPAGVEVEAFGTLADGSPYNARGTAQASRIGSVWVDFYPNADFAPLSEVCVRTTFKGDTGAPACVTIYRS